MAGVFFILNMKTAIIVYTPNIWYHGYNIAKGGAYNTVFLNAVGRAAKSTSSNSRASIYEVYDPITYTHLDVSLTSAQDLLKITMGVMGSYNII